MMKGGGLTWVDRTVKGWAIMSRWGVETPAREPFLFALDPETTGEPLSNEEVAEVVQDIARAHVRLTLEGLGYTDLLRDPNDVGVARPPRQRDTVVLQVEVRRRVAFSVLWQARSGCCPSTSARLKR
jgi:hypothetical protein